jgi:hypothetical protein
MVLAGLPLAAGATPPDDPCSERGLRDHLAAAGVPASDVRLTGPGAVLTLQQGGVASGALWFGFLPSGELVTTQRQVGLAATARADLTALFSAVIGRLDRLTDLRGCASLALRSFDAAAGQGHIEATLKPTGVALSPAKGAPRSSLALATHLAVAAALGLYVALAAGLAVRSARRRPREALLVLGLAAVALLVRLATSARGPIEAANADFTHVVDVEAWLRHGLAIYPGAAYPPAYRVLLLGLFGLAGPSLDAAFWLTTVLGSLVPVPAYLLARRVTGSVLAGTLAGLALAAYPPAIYFSNGLALVTPAALLLALAFAHAEAAATDGDRWDLAAWLLALVLFVQCRTEAAGIAALALVAHAARFVEARRVRAVLARGWPLLLAAAAAVLPYAWLTAEATAATPVRDVAVGLLATGLVRLAAVAAGAVAASFVLARVPALRLPALLAAVGAAFVGVQAAVTGSSGNAFAPVPTLIPEVPFVDFHSEAGPFAFLSFAHTADWQQAAFLPLAFGALRWLSLAPRIAAKGPRLPVTVVALVALPLVGGELTGFISTGIAGLEGLRFHVPYTGLVAASVGIGAWRVLTWTGLARGQRGLLAAALAALVLSPLATHAALTRDTDRDQRAEYLFARDALARLPDDALVVLPDEPFTLDDDTGSTSSTSAVFRTPHLLRAVAFGLGRRLELRGLGELAPGSPLPEAGAWLFCGLDAYRAPRPLAESPVCEAARRIVKRPPVALTTVPTRVHSNHSLERIGPTTATMQLRLVRVEAAEVAALQAVLAPTRRPGDRSSP